MGFYTDEYGTYFHVLALDSCRMCEQCVNNYKTSLLMNAVPKFY